MKRVFLIAVAALALFAQNPISEACCVQINGEDQIVSNCTGSHGDETIVAGGCTERPGGGSGVKNGTWSDPPENCLWGIKGSRCRWCDAFVPEGESHRCPAIPSHRSEACCVQINGEDQIVSNCTGSHGGETIVAGGCTERPDGGSGVKNGLWSDPPENCNIRPDSKYRCAFCGEYVHTGEPHNCYLINLDGGTNLDNPKTIFPIYTCPICNGPVDVFPHPYKPNVKMWQCKAKIYHQGEM